jgi:muramoyltetrapeptide carboxypeptidase
MGIFSSLAFAMKPNLTFSQINPNNRKVLKPNKLKSGDTIGIIAPATAVSSSDDIQKAYELLDYLELKPKFSKNFANREGYKTKDIKLRANDINEMFEDKNVNAIICIRGGYGSMGILSLIDYKMIEKNPKIFIGYSDITAIHLAIQNNTSLATLHGPMLLSDYSENSMEFYKKALFTNSPIGKISNPDSSNIRETYPVKVIHEGVATGDLTGGNLSLISSLMGTSHEINTAGKILFLEEVGEEPYRIDRMLTQLKLAGKFDKVKGVVFGKCQDCIQKSVPSVWDSTLAEVLDAQFAGSAFPVLYGLLIGHTSVQYPIPYSLQAKLDTKEGSLEILESFCV